MLINNVSHKSELNFKAKKKKNQLKFIIGKKTGYSKTRVHTYTHTLYEHKHTHYNTPTYARDSSPQIDCAQQEVLHGWQFSFLFSA